MSGDHYDQREDLHRQRLVQRGATSDGYKPTGPRPEPAPLPTDPIRKLALDRIVPMTVWCSCCDHEWIALYLPMPLDQVADIMRTARCPKGCRAEIYMANGRQL